MAVVYVGGVGGRVGGRACHIAKITSTGAGDEPSPQVRPPPGARLTDDEEDVLCVHLVRRRGRRAGERAGKGAQTGQATLPALARRQSEPPAHLEACATCQARPPPGRHRDKGARAPPRPGSRAPTLLLPPLRRTVINSPRGFLRPPFSGTLTCVPSSIFSSACCTPSPLTSRVIVTPALARGRAGRGVINRGWAQRRGPQLPCVLPRLNSRTDARSQALGTGRSPPGRLRTPWEPRPAPAAHPPRSSWPPCPPHQ